MALTKVGRSLLNTGVADSSDATAITISSAEDATFAGHILLADSKNVKIGAGTDLQLYHDGTNSYITNSTGALKIATETSGIAVTIGHTTSETTIADNLTVTGTVAAGVITADGLDMGDSEKIRLGAAQDLEIYHDGSHSYIYDGGTGNIVLKTNNGANVDIMGASEYMAKFIKDGAVELYYNDAKKLETTSAGITVTGAVTGNLTGDVTGTADTATVATTVTITDNESTDEDNAVIFTAGGDVDGGNLGLESDGDLTYNPSSGTLTATAFSASGGFLNGANGGIRIHSGGAKFFNVTAANAARDNIMDIGASDARFKDLHIGGAAYIDGGAVFNEDSADVDFRVESNDSTHMFFVDAGNNTILMSSNPADDTQATPHDTLTLATAYSSSGANGVAGLGPRIVFKIPDDETNPSIGGGIAVVKESADDSDSSAAMTFAISQNDETLDEAMRIKSDGSLLVGNDTDTQSIFGRTAIGFVSGFSDHAFVGHLDVADTGGYALVQSEAGATYLNSEDGQDLSFSIHGTRKMVLDDSGKLGIGTTSPQQALHVFQTEGSVGAKHATIRLGGYSTTGAEIAAYRYDSYSNNQGLIFSTYDATNGVVDRWRIDINGRQSYDGSTANAHTTFVGEVGSGFKALAFERTVGGGEVGSIVANASSTTYNTSSDYRLKENVDYDWDATTRLKQLKPARFNWIKDDTNTLLEGFLAHEVSSVVPEAVSGEKDAMTEPVLYGEGDELPTGKKVGDVKKASAPDYQGIDQSKLVPLMVKTIQELEARIKTLEDA